MYNRRDNALLQFKSYDQAYNGNLNNFKQKRWFNLINYFIYSC
jgi:hypothetical protein